MLSTLARRLSAAIPFYRGRVLFELNPAIKFHVNHVDKEQRYLLHGLIAAMEGDDAFGAVMNLSGAGGPRRGKSGGELAECIDRAAHGMNEAARLYAAAGVERERSAALPD